jgi:hypothetical protein
VSSFWNAISRSTSPDRFRTQRLDELLLPPFRAVAALAIVAFGTDALGATDAEGTAGLLSDLERIIAADEDTWFVDSYELDEMLPDVLESVCRSTPAARGAAIEALQARLASIGDPKELYRAAGERTARVDEALSIWRQHRALSMAVAHAEQDCPFWVEPRPGFPGRQTDRHRFTLNAETGGIVQLRQTEGTWTLGAGGNGRLLPAYGFGDRFTVLAGAEFGGGAMLRPGATPSQFIINYFPAIPVILRFRQVAWHYDLETAAVALFQADDTDVSYGVRVGGGIGVSALRPRSFIPWAGIAAAYEYYLESGGRSAAHFVRGGFRVGLRWDP